MNAELALVSESGGDYWFWAHRGDQLVGVVWAQATSHATVMIAPPRFAEGMPANIGRRLLESLLRAVEERAPGERRCLVALIDESEEDDRSSVVLAQLLSDKGFERITTVDFLVATALATTPDSSLRIRRVESGEEERFAQTLRETTADADAADSSVWVRWRRGTGVDLNEDDVETSGTGESYFVQHGDRLVGVLVLAAARQDDTAREVQYLGIHPSERRRGFAVEALHAVRDLAAREGRLVTASVDSTQIAAVRAYHRAEFFTYRRRVLWAKRLN